MKKIILLVLFSLFPFVSFAWNDAGHKIIAEIAYQNLSPAAKKQLYCLMHQFQRGEPQIKTFQQMATWPDVLRSQGITAFNSWHFVNRSLSGRLTDGGDNAIWAVQQAETALQSPNADPFMRAWFLAFLAHIEGDLHQPLHNVNVTSKKLPQGDQGGNLYSINTARANNLHQLWDGAVGALPINSNKQSIDKLAQAWQQQYPQSYFGKKTQDLNPQDWSDESVVLAVHAYELSVNQRPTAAYIAANQKIAMTQIVLAGYRLANLLNQLLPGVRCHE